MLQLGEDGLPLYYTEELKREIEKRTMQGLAPNKQEELHSYAPFLKSLLDQIVGTTEKYLYDKRRINIAYAVLRSNSLDAFSYSSDKNLGEHFDFIGISEGKISRTIDIFTTILSSKDSFFGYGNTDLERDDLPPLLLMPREDNSEPYTRPKCALRREAAMTFAMTATQFVLLHEITHLMHGHLEWHREIKGSTAIVDGLGANRAVSDTDGMLYQALELDADQGALIILSEMITSASANLHQMRNEVSEVYYQGQEMCLGTTERAIRTVLYSIYILMRSEYPGPWTERDFKKSSHPHPLLRARLLVLKLSEIIPRLVERPMSSEGLITFMWAIVLEAEQDLARATGRDKDIVTFAESLRSKAAGEHLDEATRAYQSLRPFLAENSRCTHLPN